MTPDEFTLHLQQHAREIEDAVNNDLPIVMGKTAVDFYKENFQNESFTDESPKPWQEVKRRLNPRTTGARASRPILTGDTGDLGESIEYRNAANGQVSIVAEAFSKNGFNYAPVHNNGVRDAGRARNTVIPQRQYIAPSRILDELIQIEINRKINRIIKP